MKTISIQIDEDIAREYNKIASEQRKRIDSLFIQLVQQQLKKYPSCRSWMIYQTKQSVMG